MANAAIMKFTPAQAFSIRNIRSAEK